MMMRTSRELALVVVTLTISATSVTGTEPDVGRSGGSTQVEIMDSNGRRWQIETAQGQANLRVMTIEIPSVARTSPTPQVDNLLDETLAWRTFAAARVAFRRGDYRQAENLMRECTRDMPNLSNFGTSGKSTPAGSGQLRPAVEPPTSGGPSLGIGRRGPELSFGAADGRANVTLDGRGGVGVGVDTDNGTSIGLGVNGGIGSSPSGAGVGYGEGSGVGIGIGRDGGTGVGIGTDGGVGIGIGESGGTGVGIGDRGGVGIGKGSNGGTGVGIGTDGGIGVGEGHNGGVGVGVGQRGGIGHGVGIDGGVGIGRGMEHVL
jgi:hypothetical protein